MELLKLVTVLILILSLSGSLVSTKIVNESLDSILENWAERQSSPAASDTLEPYTLREKILFYDKDKGILNSARPRVHFLSKSFPPPPSDKDTGSNGEDLRIHWNVVQLIENANPNFRVEIHNVTTNDSYILTLFRIVNKNCPTKDPPTFFQHGFLGSAADWLLLDPPFSLPIRLARAGKDVWLGNSRGNQYSQGHKFLSPKQPQYWNFTFHEQGTLDTPAIIDYILENTSQPQINYVGHGLGTTIFYVCLSKYPDLYNHKIHNMVGLGPMAFLSRTQSPIKYLTPLVKFYQAFPEDGPLIPSRLSSYLRFTNPELCRIKIYGRSLCSDVLFFIYGADVEKTVGKKVIPRILGHSPSTTSYKNLIHVLQLFTFNSFREFDYGLFKNSLSYSQTVPPKYNLFLIETPTLNYYGQRDLLIDRKDAEQTVSELGTGTSKLNIQVSAFDLAGFIYSEYFFMAVGDGINVYLTRKVESMGTRRIAEKREQRLETCTCRGHCHPNTNNNSQIWQETSYFKNFQSDKVFVQQSQK